MLDMVIGRHGDSVAGRVLNESITVHSHFGDFKIPKSKIRRIDFNNPGPAMDDVAVMAKDQVTGKVLDPSIRLRADGETFEIPTQEVLELLVDWISAKPGPALTRVRRAKARRRPGR